MLFISLSVNRYLYINYTSTAMVYLRLNSPLKDDPDLDRKSRILKRFSAPYPKNHIWVSILAKGLVTLGSVFLKDNPDPHGNFRIFWGLFTNIWFWIPGQGLLLPQTLLVDIKFSHIKPNLVPLMKVNINCYTQYHSVIKLAFFNL